MFAGITTGYSSEIDDLKLSKYHAGQALVIIFTAAFESTYSSSSQAYIGMSYNGDGLLLGKDSTGVYFNRRSNR